jgi:flagellar hook-associated protein 1 FlgK
MGGLLSALANSAGAFSVYDQEFTTISNNISNANTPGYANQSLALEAKPFDPSEGTTGGVTSAGLLSSRSEYLEQNVRNQQTLLGDSQQTASDLGEIQPLFDPNSTTGVAGTLNSFFNSFSQLSVNPNDEPTRQNVISAAGQVAQSFNEAANGIAQVADGVQSQTGSTVTQINQLASEIANLNSQYQGDSASAQDAGLDAQMHTDLESLSTLTNFSIVQSSNGTFNVFLGGQTPLVIGDQQYQISAGFSSGQTEILDSQSNDVTSEITGGSLGAMIQENNTTLPGYMTQLNTLAQTFADQVNGQLSQGLDESGATPTTNLFTYDQPSDAASTLAVTDIAADQIAAASAGAPGGNGNAVAVAQLASAAVVGGTSTFTQAFGNLSAQVGNDVANAQQEQTDDQDLVTQAQTQRQQVSGVSLDAQAAELIQFQQSYEAVGQMVTVLNSLTQTLLDIVPLGSST